MQRLKIGCILVCVGCFLALAIAGVVQFHIIVRMRVFDQRILAQRGDGVGNGNIAELNAEAIVSVGLEGIFPLRGHLGIDAGIQQTGPCDGEVQTQLFREGLRAPGDGAQPCLVDGLVIRAVHLTEGHFPGFRGIRQPDQDHAGFIHFALHPGEKAGGEIIDDSFIRFACLNKSFALVLGHRLLIRIRCDIGLKLLEGHGRDVGLVRRQGGGGQYAGQQGGAQDQGQQASA